VTVVGSDLICDQCSMSIRLGASSPRNRSSIRSFGTAKGWTQDGGKDLCPKCRPERDSGRKDQAVRYADTTSVERFASYMALSAR
jgi:hypothetical protein